MKFLTKLLAFAFLIFFAVSIYWQNNDSDASTWYALYGIGAFASLLFLLNRLPRWLAFTFAVVFFVKAYMNWPEKFEQVAVTEWDMNCCKVALSGEDNADELVAAMGDTACSRADYDTGNFCKNVEESREAGGMVISGAILLLLAAASKEFKSRD